MHPIDKCKDSQGRIGKEEIKRIIPYNEHFLFIDEVSSLEKKRIVAVKKIDSGSDFLKGHFVDFPIMPGALIIEGLGQAATILARYHLDDHENYDVLAHKIRDAKFIHPVFGGDIMLFDLTLLARTERNIIVDGKVFVGEKLVSTACMMLAMVDKKTFREKHSS